MNPNKSIDYLKAFSMLYIVGYWHLFDYTNSFPYASNPITNRLTLIVLGLFVFISGFLMGGNSSAILSAKAFYKRRLARIYPLYAFAVVLFMYYGINDLVTSAKALLGLSMFWLPAPLTLWFITMILAFYLITPLLLRFAPDSTRFAVLSFFIIACALVIQVLFRSVDARVFLYFPCFCLGIFCARHGFRVSRPQLGLVLTGFLSGVVMSLFLQAESWTLSQMKDVPMVLAGAYLTFCACFSNEEKFRVSRIITTLSYISFAMYLFHRPIFVTMKAIYFPSSGVAQILYLVLVCLPIIALASWILQSAYDGAYLAVAKRIKALESA